MKIKTLPQVFRCLIPSKLPIGEAQFDAWAKSIFSTYDLQDKPNNRHTMATAIMHLGPTVSYKSKHYFYKTVIKSLANETAFETIQRLKKAEKEYLEKHMSEVAPV